MISQASSEKRCYFSWKEKLLSLYSSLYEKYFDISLITNKQTATVEAHANMNISTFSIRKRAISEKDFKHATYSAHYPKRCWQIDRIIQKIMILSFISSMDITKS